jgi:hypothetical protein
VTLNGQTTEQDTLIQQIVREYETGNINNAEFLAFKALKKKDTLSPEQQLEIHKYLAFCFIASGERQNAVDEFVEMLKINANYRFPRQATSPKIISVFDEATRVFKQTLEINKENPLKAEETLNLKASKLSLVFPGRGQLYKGQKGRGYVYIGAEVLSLATLIYSQWQYQETHSDYLDAEIPQDIEAKYKRYDQFYKLRNFSAAAVVLTYACSFIDCLYTKPAEEKKNLSLSYSHQQIILSINF